MFAVASRLAPDSERVRRGIGMHQPVNKWLALGGCLFTGNLIGGIIWATPGATLQHRVLAGFAIAAAVTLTGAVWVYPALRYRKYKRRGWVVEIDNPKLESFLRAVYKELGMRHRAELAQLAANHLVHIERVEPFVRALHERDATQAELDEHLREIRLGTSPTLGAGNA